MYASSHVCGRTCVQVCEHMHMESWGWSLVLLNCSAFYLLRHGLLLDQEFMSLTSLAGQLALGILSLSPECWDYKHVCLASVSPGDPVLSHSAWQVFESTEPSPQPGFCKILSEVFSYSLHLFPTSHHLSYHRKEKIPHFTSVKWKVEIDQSSRSAQGSP